MVALTWMDKKAVHAAGKNVKAPGQGETLNKLIKNFLSYAL